MSRKLIGSEVVVHILGEETGVLQGKLVKRDRSIFLENAFYPLEGGIDATEKMPLVEIPLSSIKFIVYVKSS